MGKDYYAILEVPRSASEADIKRLLLGKDKDVKDQVAHFYEAQLIHYGLQRSKDKNAAKVRLQQALGQGKLKAQPPYLADMEAQMKVGCMLSWLRVLARY